MRAEFAKRKIVGANIIGLEMVTGQTGECVVHAGVRLQMAAADGGFVGPTATINVVVTTGPNPTFAEAERLLIERALDVIAGFSEASVDDVHTALLTVRKPRARA